MYFLRVDSKRITNEIGKPLELKGVNLGSWLMMEGYILGGRNISQREFEKTLEKKLGKKGAEKFIWDYRNAFIKETDIKRIKYLGFNCVRLPFNYRFIEKTPYNYSEQSLRYLDKVISWFEKYNVYCILDLHAAPGSQNEDWHSDSSGEALLWKSKSYQKRTIAIWQKLADRYHNKSCIAGYDILNEPVTKNKTLLNKLYKEIAEEIRSSDKKHIIFLEGNMWARDLNMLSPPSEDNIAYSIHFYTPIDFTFNFKPGLTYPGIINGERWDKNRIKSSLNSCIKFRNRYNIPILIGEFGINLRCPVCHSELNWLTDIISVFKKLGFSWIYWTYKAVAGDVFPGGIYQLLDNLKWVNRQGPVKGWENFFSLEKTERKRLFRELDTKNFVKSKTLTERLGYSKWT